MYRSSHFVAKYHRHEVEGVMLIKVNGYQQSSW